MVITLLTKNGFYANTGLSDEGKSIDDPNNEKQEKYYYLLDETWRCIRSGKILKIF